MVRNPNTRDGVSLAHQAVSCMKALRRACVSHFMGKIYNGFLEKVKGQSRDGESTEVWKMVSSEEGAKRCCCKKLMSLEELALLPWL